MPVWECNLHRLSCLNMGQREKKKEWEGRKNIKERERNELDRLIHFSLLFGALFLSSLCLLFLSLSLPNLCGHCWGVTGACSNTIPVTQGEEWPPFPLHSLSFPPGRPACLFVFPDIRRHLNSPVKRRTMHQDETNS